MTPPLSKEARLRKIIEILFQNYPDPKIALHFGNEFELLVAVILSAQCTDERVNKVTPALFERFRTVKDYAEADILEIEQLIFSTGFYRNKAKNIQGAARAILEKFAGELPRTMDELLTLPGVARKTANVVLGTAFNIRAGIVVDTHVLRLGGLLGLISRRISETKNAVLAEKELMKIVPPENWREFAHLLSLHGRKICVARRPKCSICPLSNYCPSAKL